jgi:hypothetical protein
MLRKVDIRPTGLHGVVACLSRRKFRGDRYPCRSPTYGSVAQLAERRTHIPCVGGSIPSTATNFVTVVKWPKTPGCDPGIRWFESNRSPHISALSSVD